MNNNGSEAGKGQAIASLVLGIISVCTAWFGWGALAGIILGAVGAVMAVQANKKGYNGGMSKAGMVLSIIGIVLSAIMFVACTICSAVSCLAWS